MFGDRNADKNNANHGQRLGVRCDRSLLPDTAGSPILRFLLTAREGSLWVDRLRQGINSALGRHSGGGRCGVPSHQSRGRWHPLIPPKVAPFYTAANTSSPP
jgi:hypothetical protein